MRAELADGRILEFPDGTDPAVVQATVKKVLGVAPETAPAAPKEPTAVDRTNAAITGMNRGIAGIVGLPMDTIENVYNLGKAGVGTVATALGRPDMAPELTKGTPLGSQWIADKLKGIGVATDNPRPDDTASRMLHMGGTVVGGSMVPGARPVPTALAATGAAIGGEVSDNPLAPALGAMAPAASRAAAAGLKTAVANPQRVQQNVDTFERAGVTPSVGQATESAFFRGLENTISKFPGGQGVMRRFAENQQRTLGQSAQQGNANAETAGRAIEHGVRGDGGFLERTNATWQNLDNQLAARIGNATITPTNTVNTLNRLTTPTPGAENTTGALINPTLANVRQQLAADMTANNGVLPYEALRALRTRVGSMLDNSLVTGVPNGELRQLYRGLSQDIEAAATANGAGAEFARQNRYYSARMDRIESVLNKVIGQNKLPEDIFKAVNPTNPDQANRVRAVMRSLDPAERQTVTEAIINRMGRSTPGRQNDAGDVFSSETFLTNWNKLSPAAKAQVMPDQPMRENMNAIASVGSNIREGSKVFANPSGTAGAVAPYGLTVMAATGGALPALGIVSGANVGARMLTNPAVVRWLATAPRVSAQAAPAYLAQLGVIFNKTKDEQLKGELAQYMSSFTPEEDYIDDNGNKAIFRGGKAETFGGRDAKWEMYGNSFDEKTARPAP